MNESPILIEKNNNGLIIITLNRVEKSNAFDEKMIQQLIATLQAYHEDTTVKALLLNASGKNFCAGGDLNWMQRMVNYSQEENYQDAMQLSLLLETLNNFNKPTLALVQGACYGGGIGLIACCDIVVAASDAHFCFSEVKIGLAPATISPYVIAAIGARAARRYFLTAEKFTAEEAKEMGLVHQVVPLEQLNDAGFNLINTLLKNAPSAMQAAKKLTQKFNKFDNNIQQEMSHLLAILRTSAEGQEGLKAFLEKRKPNWQP